MWVKQCHKLAMTGNGKHTTYKNGDDWGMVYGIVLTTLVQFVLVLEGAEEPRNRQPSKFLGHFLRHDSGVKEYLGRIMFHLFFHILCLVYIAVRCLSISLPGLSIHVELLLRGSPMLPADSERQDNWRGTHVERLGGCSALGEKPKTLDAADAAIGGKRLPEVRNWSILYKYMINHGYIYIYSLPDVRYLHFPFAPFFDKSVLVNLLRRFHTQPADPCGDPS